MQAYQQDAPLAIIAGTGGLPQHIIDARKARGTETFILAIEGNTPAELVQGVPHRWFRIGAVGEALQVLKEENISQIVMAGRIKRPSLRQIMPDGKGAQLLKKMGKSLFSGDDRLMTTIIDFFEQEGFNVLGAHDVCDSLTASEGLMTKTCPSTQDMQDMNTGKALLESLSKHDVGQAVIVQHYAVLGIEAVEGTAILIERCGQLASANGGVLVKMPKVGQEMRADMPAVGCETIDALHKAGFNGLFVQSGATLMLDKDRMIKRADALGLFIQGFVQ